MKIRVDKIVEGNVVFHEHGIEDLNSTVTDKYVEVAGDTMTGALKVDVATATDAVMVEDASGNKKFSVQHGTNTVKQDFYSPEPDNKITNGGFETDLSSWTSVLSYILNDQFTTARSAGAVNGTSAEPTGGTRTVVDTENKLSIASGQLSFSGGKTVPAWNNPSLAINNLVTRAAGKVFTTQITNSSGMLAFGGSEAIGNSSRIGLVFNGTNILHPDTAPHLGSIVFGTSYKVASILRTSGFYTFIKGGAYTNWSLLWQSSYSSGNLYPAISNYSAIATSDYIRIPTSTWLPSNGVVYDNFTR